MSKMNDMVFPDARVFFHPILRSDHRILKCTLKFKPLHNPTDKHQSSAPHPTKKLKLDLAKLKNDEKCPALTGPSTTNRKQCGKWKKTSEAINAWAITTIGPKIAPVVIN